MKGYKQVLGIGVGVALTALLTNPAFAFIGPETGQSPGTGGGLFYIDSSRNIGFGTESPTPTQALEDTNTATAHGYVFTVASTTNPGIGLFNTTSNKRYVWSARNHGPLDLFREDASTGKIFLRFLPDGRLIMNPSGFGWPTSGSDFLMVGGSVVASTTITGQSFSGIGTNITAINPANITGNPFASANYAFPSALAVGTSTTIGLPTEGLFVKGSVGIGTASPQKMLHLNGVSPVIRLQTDEATNAGVQFYKGAAQVGYLFWDETEDVMKFIAGTGSTADHLVLDSAGDVGIGTSTPAYKLTVVGTSYFSDEMTFAAGAQITMSTSSNAIDMAGGDITGVGKITVATLDPLYQIGTSKYATYVASIAGGVKEEYVGQGRLTASNQELYEYVIYFDEMEQGSDLWVWYKVVDFSRENVDVFVTPYGQLANIYYVIEGEKLIFRGDKPAEFSYRLVGRRFDWRNWPTYAKDQSERASFTISE